MCNTKVDELSARELHEDAIHLYSLCATAAPDYVKGVDINRLHETCANALLAKGDFDKAVKHYIDGNAEFVSVIRRFPDLVPPAMHALLNIGGSGGNSGSVSFVAGVWILCASVSASSGNNLLPYLNTISTTHDSLRRERHRWLRRCCSAQRLLWCISATTTVQR